MMVTRVRRLLLAVLVLGLLARILYVGQVATLPFFQEPVGDSARYLLRAREILSGDLIGDRPFFYGGVLYPYLLAPILKASGGSLYPVALAQALAGCALALVLYALVLRAAREGGEASAGPIGLAAAGIALLYGPLAFLEADLLATSWGLLGQMGAAWLLLAARALPPGARAGLAWAGAGVCLGLSASERPNLVALLPVAAGWAALFPRGIARPGGASGAIAAAATPRAGTRARVAAAGLVLAGGASIVGLVSGINYAASGRWVLLTTSGGINFYIGNHEGARGSYDEPWSADQPAFTAEHTDLEESSVLMAGRLAGRRLDAVEASAFWLAEGLRFLREHPAEAARLYARKAALLFGAREIPNHLDFEFIRGLAPALWLMPLGFGLVAPLGLYALLSPSTRRLLDPPAAALLALLVAVPALTVLPFFVADRYRIAAVPPLIVLAAFGAVDLAGRLARPMERRAATLALACLVLLGLALSRPRAAFDRSRDHWMLAQAYKKQGRHPEAATAYGRALEESPSNPALLNNLGVLLGMMGDERGAERRYREAIAADGTFTLPHRNLGLLLMRRGDPHAAFEHLARAEEAAGGSDVEVARALAVVYVARGDREEALRRARRVLEQRPGDPTALGVIRHLEPR